MTDTALAAARELTGFDAVGVDAGTDVLVVGTDGVGVRTLVEACRALAPDLDIVARGGRSRASAGAAVVVVDPSSSVGEEERLLVEQLRAQVGIVAIVCTKIDAFWEWPRTVRAHRAVLDPFATLPLFGVSSVAALEGAVDESGIDALVEWLRETTDAPGVLRAERARLAAGLGAVEHLLGAPTGGVDEAASAQAAVDDLLATRRELVAARDRGRPDRLAAVRAGLARVRSQTSAELHAGVRDLAASAAGHAPAADSAYGAWARTGWAALADGVRRRADERVDAVRSTALVGLDAEPSADENWPAVPLHTERSRGRARRAGAEDALVVVLGASTGLGVGRLVVAPMESVQTLQWVSMPLALILGVAVAAWVIRVRRSAAERSDREARTAELLAEARATLDHQLALRVTAAETRIAGQIARAHERRNREVAAEVARLDEEIRRLRSGVGVRDARTRRERAAEIRRELVARSESLWADASRTDDPGEESDDPAGRRGDRGHDDGTAGVARAGHDDGKQ
ncbi:hypothetical protein GR168_20955 [Gordonia sp. JH63]|uniref:hypothetical protein n=1 Tax=Gordonia sp. JH63 TaxID=2698900 RepID=UPI00131F8684|nr:hypothetical protein [Gordonia sp. JH63]QHD87577.1 hypothetical protein GR168_20955 [Gordonia sp. JH63]